MNTIELIAKTIKARYSANDVTVTPTNNRGILIKVDEFSKEVEPPTIINLVTEILHKSNCKDNALITHKNELEVYIDIPKSDIFTGLPHSNLTKPEEDLFQLYSKALRNGKNTK